MYAKQYISNLLRWFANSFFRFVGMKERSGITSFHCTIPFKYSGLDTPADACLISMNATQWSSNHAVISIGEYSLCKGIYQFSCFLCQLSTPMLIVQIRREGEGAGQSWAQRSSAGISSIRADPLTSAKIWWPRIRELKPTPAILGAQSGCQGKLEMVYVWMHAGLNCPYP